MKEIVRRTLEEVGAKRDETARGFFELSESSAFGSENFLRMIDPLRKFVGAGFAIGGRPRSACTARHTVATELNELGDRTAMKSALGMSDATVARYAEHRRFDRAAALFVKNEARQRPAGWEEDSGTCEAP